jgi:2-methylcitrate dehydratase PrpD
MSLDPEVDRAYPAKWLGRIEVVTTDGRRLSAAIDDPKGDPGNPMSRGELEEKFHRLVAFSKATTQAEANQLISWAWRLRDASSVRNLLPHVTSDPTN